MARKKVPPRPTALTAPAPADFDDVLRLIDAARLAQEASTPGAQGQPDAPGGKRV